MKRPFIRRPRPNHPRQGERGVTMVLVAISMIAIIAMAAWSIDLVTLYLAREEAQRAADAAALAAARVLSISGITGTADPGTDTTYWQGICGGTSSAASLAAQAIGAQNSVGSSTGTVTVKYATGDGTNGTADCSSLPTVFAVNPLVTVQVQRTNLPSFFSRIWGYSGDSVSASATAEVFNPSASDVNTNGGAVGAVTPVQPRCVKPWFVPNQEPGGVGGACKGGTCTTFVSVANGSITSNGVSLSGSGANGVIGETFTLVADCGATPGSCNPMPNNPPVANSTATGFNGLGTNPPPPVNLEYVPGEASASSVAIPTCGNDSNYEAAVSGCDQSTAYVCGVNQTLAPTPNIVDLNENPGGPNGDTALGLACSLASQTSVPLAGQDVLDTTAYPFKITTAISNPLKIAPNTLVSTSNQIVTLPIYDSSGGAALVGAGNRAEVTVVGFLQVFINQVNGDGTINVTVLNVAGCGNGATPPNNAVTGSSPVPVRLITPP